MWLNIPPQKKELKLKLIIMSHTENKNDAYEFLSLKQKEIASKIEALLVGLTVNEAKELLHSVRKSIDKTKIS